MNEYAQRLLAGESLRSVIGSMSPSDHQRLLEYFLTQVRTSEDV